jgi:alkanesulfonate monooxygenase SsuD/methylene tetrahydromethanopterin reductase-like flavin-dependent oxidoreductase (luciferase family)
MPADSRDGQPRRLQFGFIPTEGGAFYRAFLDEVLLGEALGFDSVWLEEHHGVRDHYWPSPLTALAGIATRTERILFGSDVMILPFYHPVRVAEDAALLAIMSGGRFVLGTAIGYKPDEFELYQVPMEKRGARFAEALRLMRRLWTEGPVDFEGAHYQVRGLGIEPRPDPPPPVWVGGWGELALNRAAELGDAWLPGPTAHLDKLLEARAVYWQALRHQGIDPAARPAPLTRDVVIAATDAAAWEIAERHLLINYRDEYGGGRWKHPLIGAQDQAPVSELEALSQGRFLIGSPTTVIRGIQGFRETFGVDHLICRLYFPGLSHEFILSELTLIAQEVMPAFR